MSPDGSWSSVSKTLESYTFVLTVLRPCPVISWKNEVPSILTASRTRPIVSFPSNDWSESRMIRFLSSLVSDAPRSVIYAWRSSICSFWLESFDQSTSARAKYESWLSSDCWLHWYKAFSASEKRRSRPVWPQCPPRCSMSLCTDLASFVLNSVWCSCNLANADPDVFRMSLVTSSEILFGGQTVNTICTFCWYICRSSFDGSKLGTSEASWLEMFPWPSPPELSDMTANPAMKTSSHLLRTSQITSGSPGYPLLHARGSATNVNWQADSIPTPLPPESCGLAAIFPSARLVRSSRSTALC